MISLLTKDIVAAGEGLDEATNTPPQVSNEVKKEIAQSTGAVHATGADASATPAGPDAPKVKSAKECMCLINFCHRCMI